MANYSSLYATIAANIYENHLNQVTAEMVKAACDSMVASLGYGYQFRGAAAPGDAGPGNIDQRVFYIASTPGTYSGFGGLTLAANEVALLKWDSAWSKETLDIPSKTQIMARLAAQDAQIALQDGRLDGQDQEIADFEEAVQNQVDNYPMITIEGNVTNAPDEEDLTSVEENGSRVLKFKNRSAVDGMGYVILRKGGNNTFANQVTEANTIYEIRYDFDLGGDSVTIPRGCVLMFVGGKLANGTLVGQNTKIVADQVRIFGKINIAGDWLVPDIYSGWFDFSEEEEFDNSANFKNISNLLSENIHNNLFIQQGVFYTQADNGFPRTLYTRSRPAVMRVKSNTDVFCSATIKLLKSENVGYSIFEMWEATNIGIYGGTLIGDLQYHTSESASGKEWGHGVFGYVVSNILVEGVSSSYMLGDGICFSGEPLGVRYSHDIRINDCYSSYNHRQGISLTSKIRQVYIDNFAAEKIGAFLFTGPGAGIDIEPDFGDAITDNLAENIVIKNSRFIDNYLGVLLYLYVKNIVIDNCSVAKTDEYPFSYPGYAVCIQSYTDLNDYTAVITNCDFVNQVALYSGKIRISDCSLQGVYLIDNDDDRYSGKIDLHLERCVSTYLLKALDAAVLSGLQGVLIEDCEINIADGSQTAFYNLTNDTTWPIPINVRNTTFNVQEGVGRLYIRGNLHFEKCVFKVYGIYFVSDRAGKTELIDCIGYFSERTSVGYRIQFNPPATDVARVVNIYNMRCYCEDAIGRAYWVGFLGTGTNYGNYVIKNMFIEKCTELDRCSLVTSLSAKPISMTIDIDAQLKVAANTTAKRPTLTSSDAGYQYFDTSLNPKRPIWWNGAAWVDATGTSV